MQNFYQKERESKLAHHQVHKTRSNNKNSNRLLTGHRKGREVLHRRSDTLVRCFKALGPPCNRQMPNVMELSQWLSRLTWPFLAELCGYVTFNF